MQAGDPNDNENAIVLYLRARGTGEKSELHLTATAPFPEGGDSAQRAEEAFRAVARTLRERGAAIFSERIFAPSDAFPAIDAIRAAAYGDLDDGMPPTRLLGPAGEHPALGIQIHAVGSAERPEVLRSDAGPIGRCLRAGEHGWTFLGAMHGGSAGTPHERAARMFRTAEERLTALQQDFTDVARTWLWLGDICAWYDDLNAARTEFFERIGMYDPSRGAPTFPASTGIGIYPVDPQDFCTMDLIAVTGPEGTFHWHDVDGEQNSAFDYGSAFSRAATVATPGGRTVFVSGTAAIDADGVTEYPDEVEPQVEATLAHVRALLGQHGCADVDVLSHLAYCKNEAVRRAFLETDAGQTWPGHILMGDVCRHDLTFEIEVAAAPQQ